MNDKRRSAFSSFGGWFRELPWQVRAGGVALVVLGLILALLPRSLFHSFNCEVQNLPQNYRSSNGYFIDNQVIVVGPRDDVDAIIGTPVPGVPTTQAPPTTSVPSIPSITPTTAVPPATLEALGTPPLTGTPESPAATATPVASEKVILNFIEGCDLSYLNSRTAAESNSTVEDRKLVMRLYEIPRGSTVGNVITQIGDKAQGRDIFADPNYLTRLADSTTDPCALPTDGGGSGGRPFGVPGTRGTSYDPVQAQADFNAQWAFGSQGINLLLTPSPAFTGRGVRVGVFDTSPYRIRLPFIKRVGEASPSPMWFTNWDAGGNTMMSNHGLFVASLIHRIAPKSRIQLVRVLNDDGCGELWTLNKGLESYKSRKSAWSSKLNKTVINMSLGIRVPDAQSGAGLTALQREELGTLQSLIDAADEMGAIIIASAGNDSTIKVSSTTRIVDMKPMQVPASFDNVIGVAATNPNGQRSCYSNNGDVAAPGGEGGPRDEKQPDGTMVTNPCAPRADTWDQPPGSNGSPVCTRPENCAYVVIGLARTRYGEQYVYWSGTSFAAPMVSGMAALAYEQMGKAKTKCLINGGPTSTTTPDPELGMGLIDMRDLTSTTALGRCP